VSASGARSEPQASEVHRDVLPPGPPPLRSLGLVLHRDGRFLHEGAPVTNARLRAAFERGVRYLPAEGKYVVTLGHFRGQLDVEECGFFVRSVDLDAGLVALSDGSLEPFDAASLRCSKLDSEVLLCTVKRAIAPHGVPARFEHGAQAELLAAVEEDERGCFVRVAGRHVALPPF
jgi:hypothetical protein